MNPHTRGSGNRSRSKLMEWNDGEIDGSVSSRGGNHGIGITESSIVREGEYRTGFDSSEHSFVFRSFVLLDIFTIVPTQCHHFHHSWNRRKQSPLPLSHRIDECHSFVTLLFFVQGEQLIQTLDRIPLFVRKGCESIDDRVHFPDFWDEICLKMLSVFSTDTPCKKGSVPEKVSECTILATRTILDVVVADTHRILGKESVSHKERDLLIPDKQPGFGMEKMFVQKDRGNHAHETRTRIDPVRKKEHSDHGRNPYNKGPFDYMQYEHDPMLVRLIDNSFFESFGWRHGGMNVLELNF